MADFDLRAYLQARRELVETELVRRLPALPPELGRLGEAMAYSLMAGGKRLRPILCLAGAELLGSAPESVLPTACALEFIHTYSLIHDDLPAMDDDDLRRGLPTCHVKFGEGLAILAGDGLLTEAFDLLADQARTHDPALVLEVAARIARAAGARGMVGGQALDLAAQGRTDFTAAEVEFVHRCKTGALLTVALVAGARLSGAGGQVLAEIEAFGQEIGAAFQIVDDLLDIEGDTAVLGKPAGSDQAKGKATYPAAVGLEPARRKAAELVRAGLARLESFGPAAEPLRSLANYIITRHK